MASTAVAAQEYWGYLIKPDKSPTPVFELLLLGVANYIVSACSPIYPMTLCESRLMTTRIAEQAHCAMGHPDPYARQARSFLPPRRW